MTAGLLRHRVLAAVAAAVLVTIAGTVAPPPVAGAGTQGDSPPQAPAIQSPRSAEVVRLPFPQDEGSLTPYTFELGYPLLTLVYDTLMWRDENAVPQPWLAKSVEPSPDGRRVTVRLADGARWHDGTPVTAADVAFTFRFVGERFHPRFAPQVRAVERVETPDPATAVFVLRHPAPGFADQPLSDVPILPAHLWRSLPRSKLAPEGLPVGSGPYRLADHRAGESYRFEANADYFRGAPAVATIEVPIIRTADETLRALETRRVDMLPVSLPEAAAQRAKGTGTRVVEGPSFLGTVLMFNVRRPPFDRPEIRRAVAQALDLTRLTRIVGQSVPADRGYLHPASQWAAPEPLHTFDEAATRHAFAGLNLPPITVLAPDNDPAKLEAGRQVALAIRRAGGTADVKPIPRNELSRAVGEDGSTPAFEAAIWTSPPLASYDPDFLRPLFGSNPDDAPFNYSGYRSPAFDALADRIATTADPPARQAAVTETLLLLAADAPVVPLSFATGAYAYRPSVYDGWRFIKGAGILDKRSFVEPAPAPPAPPPTPPPVSAPERPWLGWVAVGVLALAAVVGVIAVLRR